ncbi:MAG: hypothetical protein LUF35_05285 [Lachnospiraceae bacterium]|nr:hypothetical protein [Lachnospiraceae bacterium]
MQYSNILYKVYYGLGTGATMLCAQYWGSRKWLKNITCEGV